MPAKFTVANFFSPFSKPSVRGRQLPWLIGLLAVVGLAAWAYSSWSAAQVSASSPLAPALRLAIGTVNLESTGQAVDSASAAKLLPLWRLLAQLNGSGSAAPQEIAAVIEEIQLNMTSAQIQAIDAMQISATNASASSSRASAATNSASGAQSAAASAGDPMLGGDMPAGAAPMDAGGPAPSTTSAQGTSSAQTSASNPTPAAIQQVIRLLQSKVQG